MGVFVMPDYLSSRCPACNQTIGPGQSVVSARGSRYHPRCFENNTNGPHRHIADPGHVDPHSNSRK